MSRAVGDTAAELGLGELRDLDFAARTRRLNEGDRDLWLRTAGRLLRRRALVRTSSGTFPAVTSEATDPNPPSATPPGAPRRRLRYVPALLDAIVPGFGHLAAGRRRRALVFLAPVIGGIAVATLIVLTTSGPRLVAELLASEVIWSLLALQALFLLWRLLAVGSSLWNPGLPRPTGHDILPILLLVSFVVAPQAYAGYATEVARESIDQVFVDPTPLAVVPSFTTGPDPSFLEPAPSIVPSASPSPTLAGRRITGLIIGVDSGVGRNTYLTDTMIVVSLDPVTETVSMVSIPRDMVDVPLPDGRRFRDKINSLVSYARRNPAQFPGSDGTGFDVLMGALGTLLERPITYYAKVDLGGFVRVVDALRGVNVDVGHSFCDPRYDEYGFTRGFAITAGRHHLNGQQALAFARVRKPAGESDFTRAARQQEVMSGIRDAIVNGGFLNDPIGLIKAIGLTVETNVPRELLPDLADAASRVGRDKTYRAVIAHPLVMSGFDSRGSIQIPDPVAIRALSDTLFPEAGALPDATYIPPPSTGSVKGSGVSGCAPAPRPKPTTTPASSSAPSPTPSSGPSSTASPQEPPTPSPTATASASGG